MNRLSLSLSFLLFPFASAASEAEFNANYAAWKSINLSAAYDAGLSGKGVTVAVIDNGFRDTHQEFEDKGKFIRIGDYTQNHGTSVASIIGAAQNDLGMQGVAYNAVIAAAAASDIKNDDGTTPSQCAKCYAIDKIFEALKDDKYKDVKIINASWGGKDVTAALGGIPDKLLVAAAGNDMALNPAYPALTPKNDSSLKNVIGVVAFNPNVSKDNPYFLASFTNLAGEAANWTVSAPGVGFYAATETADDAYEDNFSGTSAAAPVVSGAAALVQEKFSFLTGKQIGDVLLTTANNDFSGFAPYALQEIVDEKNEENSKYRLVYFTNNKAGENDSAMSKEDVLQHVGITCDEDGKNCKMGTTKYEVVSMEYSAAYGAGILDVGKALNGLGALDGSRLADGKTMYTLEIPNDVEVEFSNNIIQRNPVNKDDKLGFSKSGGGTLILSGSNTYKGDTVVTAGTLKLTGSLAAGAAAQGGSLVIEGATIEGAVSNDASVEFNGGTIKGDFTNNSSVKMADGTLSGALKSAAGNFEMTGGTLTGNVENSGTFTMKGGAFTPAENAAFSNKGFFDYYSGSIGSNIANEGTFNNYGMFENVAVSGGALHNKEGATVGSSFSVKNFTNDGNIALLTEADGSLKKMTVKETAELTKGRFVAAVSAAAAYNNGATYTVLEAGTLSVGAGFEKDVRLVGLIDGTMTQDGNNLNMKITYLDMSDPANMPELDAKELSVAKAIDRMFKTEGNKEFGGYYYQAGTDLKKQINSLRDQIQAVKTQDLPLTNVVSNNVYSHLFRVRQQRAVNPALQNRTPQFRYRGGYYRGRSGGDDIATAKIWAQALGGYAKFGASDETNRGTAKTDMAGGQFGWDYQVSDTFLFGLTAGFASSNTKQDEDKMRVLDYRAGFYTGSRFGRVSLDTVVLGGVQRYEGRRFTDITGLTATSKSSYKGYSVEGGVNLSLETGRTPRRDHTFGIRPYVSANVSYTHQDAYKEKGDAEAINLSVSDANDTSVSVQPGMQFSYMWADAVLTLDAGWQRLLTGGNPTTKAYFINDAARTSFESLSNDADKNYVSLAIGLESNLSRRTRLKLWADQKRSKNNVISTLSAALQYAF